MSQEINTVIQGDCLEVLKNMDEESIDMCMTSPPYWGLRDYGIGPNQLGLEPTPELYIEHLTQIFHKVKQVLKKEGTLWLNIGDTYSASGKGFGDDKPDPKFKGGGRERTIKPLKIDLQPKCLCMIPERLAWSLIQDGWILRNKIIWYKPNAMPSSVKDRFSNRWEYIFLFSKNQKYYFDLDAVREPHTTQENRPHGIVRNREWEYDSKENELRGRKWSNVPGQEKQTIEKHSGYYNQNGKCLVDFSKGKNPGDVFTINTQPFPEAHFAVFPEKLVEKPIKAGCPEQVCVKCGKARERITKKYDTGKTQKMPDGWDTEKGAHGSIHRQGRSKGESGVPVMKIKTIGWTSCDCNAGFEPGTVLDPFAGAGTTLYVAQQMRRNYIGIDIKKEYVEMAMKRLAQGVL